MQQQLFPKKGQKFLANIVLKWKIKALLKIWKKRSKNSKQRYFKLKEWSMTQQSYLQKLIVIRDQIQKPLRESNLINEFQQAVIFPNLEAMIQLGQEMQSKINNLITTWNPINTLLAPTVQSLVIYLKIYKEYSNNFNKADKIIQELKKTPQYNNVIKIFNVEDYLIKPVQRPLQYKLFLTDYIKLLPPNHKDRQNLEKAKTTLLKIADQINDFVQKQLRAQKMIQLQNTFGNIIQSTREYRSQFSAIHTEFNCKVYVFNDLLLIVKLITETKEQKYMYLNLSASSYVVRQPDSVNFKNRLYICGRSESIHLNFRCSEDANIAHTLVQQLISTLYQKQFNRTELLTQMKTKRETMVMNRHSINEDYKWKEQYDYQLKLKVEVVGVEKRLYEKEWKIVYAVKIQLGRPQVLYQIVWYEIQELKMIQRYLKEVYPALVVPSLETKLKGMSYDDAKSNFTKYYEFKCILIEDFLNYVLRSKVLSKRPEFLVYKLRLHESLWDYLNRFSQDCGCEACTNSQVLSSMQSYRRQQQKIRSNQYQFCILNAFLTQNMLAQLMKPLEFKKLSVEQKLLWATCKQHRIQYGLQNRGHFGKKISFHVSIKLIGEEVEVLIENATVNDTCREIVEEVCKMRGINESMDFCLVYVHGKHEYYLDADEYAFDAVKHLDEGLKKLESDKRIGSVNRSSIFNSFSKSMDDYGDAFNDFSVSDQPKIYLRKYIFLASNLQEKACQKNHERYPVILAEYLRRFQQQYLSLSIQQIKNFCALFYGAEQFNTLVFSKNIFCNEQKLKKYLPPSKWNFIGTQFTQKVRQILQMQVKPCTNILILYKSIMYQFSDKIGSYTQYFECENVEPNTTGIKDKNLLVGLNHHKVILTRKFNSTILMQFGIQQFEYRIVGNTLLIDQDDKTYKFQGNGWFTFDDLIQKYKLIFDMEWPESHK